MIRILIAEVQQLVAGAVAALLNLEDDLDVVGIVHDGAAALRQVEAVQPDVLLADIEMPHLTGLDVAAELRRRGVRTRIVIVTTFARPGYLRRPSRRAPATRCLLGARWPRRVQGSSGQAPPSPPQLPGTGNALRGRARRCQLTC